MKKRILALLVTFAIIFSLAGCTKPKISQSSNDVEIIVEEETIVQGGNDVTSSNDNVNSIISDPQTNEQPNQQSSQQTNQQSNQQNNEQTSQQSSQQTNQQSSQESSQQSDQQSNQQTVSSMPEESSQDSQPEDTNQEPEWKSHPQDFKLLAFTFDDGPSNNTSRLVQLFSWYEGTGTFFVRGNSIIGDSSYFTMQSAINMGWDIGNHGDNHLVATTGGINGEATYDEIKADITNLTTKLETNLKTRDGAPYKVNFYRPPNIKPTANSFKICGEQNLAVIWLAHDALDWDTTKTYNNRYTLFKNGIGTWEDGDVILCHETGVVACDDTYKILEQLLPDFYRAGYRFCSISELMQMRDISIDEISGELNEVDGNRGMVTNILDAAKAGKK